MMLVGSRRSAIFERTGIGRLLPVIAIRASPVKVLAAALACFPTVGAAQTVNPEAESQRYFEAGEKALAANRLEDATQAYRMLARLNPKRAEVRAKLGLIYYMTGHLAEGVPQLQMALRINPSLPDAAVLLALCFAGLDRYADALPDLEKGFTHTQDEKVRRLIGLELVRCEMGLKRLDKAAQTALDLTRLYPDDPEILYNTAHLFGDLAYASMSRLAVVAPSSVWVHQAVGELYESKGQYDLAIAEYRRLAASDPDRPGVHFWLGRALLSRTNEWNVNGEAIAEFNREFQLSGSSGAIYEIGEIYRRAGKFEKARDAFLLAAKDRPDFEEAQIGLGRALLQLNEPAQALPHIQRALTLNSSNEVAHYQLAMVYRALGDAAAQRREMEEFGRLHDAAKERQRLLTSGLPQSSTVTSQVLDSKP